MIGRSGGLGVRGLVFLDCFLLWFGFFGVGLKGEEEEGEGERGDWG